jgi:hypothetical protein
MKEKFKLKFKKLDKANTKYRDTDFNEKRLWVSRIMAQFIKEETIIICIDESNFRHDTLPSKQWQFNMDTLFTLPSKKKLLVKRHRHNKNINLFLRTNNELDYAEYLKRMRTDNG